MLTHAAYVQDAWQVTRNLTLQPRPALGDLPVPDPRRRAGRLPLRSRRRERLQRRRGRRARRHRGQLGEGPDPAAPGCRVPSEREDRPARRLRAHLGRPAPSSTSATHTPSTMRGPTPRRPTTGSRTRSCRVTTLRQGLNTALYGTAPDLSQGVIRLPVGAGTTTYPKEPDRKYVQSWNVFAQREFNSWLSGAGWLCGNAGEGQHGLHQHQHLRPRHRQRGARAGRVRTHPGHQHDQAVRGRHLQGLQAEVKARGANGMLGIVYTLSKTENYQDTTPTLASPTRPRRSATRARPASTGATTSRRTGSTTCPSARTSAGPTDGIANALLAAGRSTGSCRS